ncbi:MAG: YfhO family protein [Patescibacteria group bacterium]
MPKPPSATKTQVSNILNRPFVRPLLFYLALNVIIFLPIFKGKINLNTHLLISSYSVFDQLLPSKATSWDQFRFFYPQISYTQTQLKAFQVPYWNPYIYAGTPHFANFQSALFYPLTVFALFLSTYSYWNFLRFTPYFLGAIFTYIYIRNLKLSNLAAFFGGLTFGFSPLMLTWGEEIVILPHSIIWLPLVLYFVDKFAESKKFKYILILALVQSLQIFSGFVQSYIYTVIVAGLYFFYRAPKSFKMVTAFFGSVFLTFAISAIQLLPSMQLYILSARNAYKPTDLYHFLLPVSQLITFFAPDYFGNPATMNSIGGKGATYYEGVFFFGIAALIFSLYAIWHHKNKLISFYLITIIITLLLTINSYFSRLQFSLQIPFLSSTIPNRALFITTFSFAVISAFGLEFFMKKRSAAIKPVIIFMTFLYSLFIISPAMSLIFKALYYADKSANALISLRNLVVPMTLFFITSLALIFSQKNDRLKKFAPYLIIGLAIIHVYLFASKYFTFTEQKFLYPKIKALEYIQSNQGLYRSWTMTGDRLLNNIFVPYKINYPEGYDPANINSYLQFTSYFREPNEANLQRTVAELGMRYSVDQTLGDNSKLRLLNILGIKYILGNKSAKEEFEKYNFKTVFADQGDSALAVYENPQVLPRAYMVSSYENFAINKKGEDTLDGLKPIFIRMRAENFDYKDSVILENQTPNFNPTKGEAVVQIVNYGPTNIEIRTKSQNPKILILTDNYYPGWRVSIDGKETQLLVANHTFKAVSVSKGDHEIKFYFKNNVYKFGAYISAISLLFTFLLLLFTGTRKNSDKSIKQK